MEIEATIARLGAQGDGVTAEGVFVPGALPGEIMRGVVEGGRMAAPVVVRAADARQAPPCPHFAVCGGCVVQHASDAFVADWKRRLILDALSAQGVAADEVAETATSPPRSRRRATFTARRTKKGTEAGFHAPRSDRIVGVEGCEVVVPTLLAALPFARDAARLGAARKGAIRVAATATEGGLDVAVEDAKPLEGRWAEAAALTEAHDLARLTWNGEPVATRRPPLVAMGRAKVAPPPGGFLQATEEGAATLAGFACNALSGARRVADLFAGSGTLTLPLAETAEVAAVEGDAAALTALDVGWRGATGLRKVATLRRDLFRRPLEAAALDQFDAVVMDPPRAGAAAQTAEIAKSGLTRLVYVSCNPATFARDARALVGAGWRLERVLPVDQFRWSAHVELAAYFAR